MLYFDYLLQRIITTYFSCFYSFTVCRSIKNISYRIWIYIWNIDPMKLIRYAYPNLDELLLSLLTILFLSFIFLCRCAGKITWWLLLLDFADTDVFLWLLILEGYLSILLTWLIPPALTRGGFFLLEFIKFLLVFLFHLKVLNESLSLFHVYDFLLMIDDLDVDFLGSLFWHFVHFSTCLFTLSA